MVWKKDSLEGRWYEGKVWKKGGQEEYLERKLAGRKVGKKKGWQEEKLDRRRVGRMKS